MYSPTRFVNYPEKRWPVKMVVYKPMRRSERADLRQGAAHRTQAGQVPNGSTPGRSGVVSGVTLS
jgi:hypothetical protein